MFHTGTGSEMYNWLYFDIDVSSNCIVIKYVIYSYDLLIHSQPLNSKKCVRSKLQSVRGLFVYMRSKRTCSTKGHAILLTNQIGVDVEYTLAHE